MLLPPALALTVLLQDPVAVDRAPLTGQHLEDEQLVDYDLGFVFGPAPAEWALWDEATCQASGWDCVALMRSEIDPYLILRLDAAPTADSDPRSWLRRYAAVSYAHLNVEEVEPRLFGDAPAAEAPLRAGEEGATIGHMMVVIHEGWAFSLTLLGGEFTRPPVSEQLGQFEESLQLVGKHLPRRQAPRGPASGRDWLLDERGFRSLSYGYSVNPGAGWRMEGGVTAHNTGDWTDLLLHHGDGRYAFLYCLNGSQEHAADLVEEELLELELRLDPESESSARDVLETRYGDLNVLRWRSETDRSENAIRAGLQVGDLVFVVDAYQESDLQPDAASAAREILEGIQLLRTSELDELRATLQEKGRGRADAGVDWSDRHGVYTDFRGGYQLLPPGEWRLRVPESADWGGERVHLHHPDFELYGSIEVFDFPVGSSLHAVHEESVAWLLEDENTSVEAARAVLFGDVHGLRTDAVSAGQTEDSTAYVIFDLSHEAADLEMWFWTESGRWTESAESAMQELLAAIRFPEGGVPKTRLGDRLVDERFGWHMTRPNASWRGTVETDGWGAPRSDVRWQKNGREVQLTAMLAEDFHNPMSGLSSVLESVRPSLLFRSLVSTTKQEAVIWGGLEATRIQFPREKLEVTWAFVDDLVYVLVLSGDLDHAGLRSFADSFRLHPSVYRDR